MVWVMVNGEEHQVRAKMSGKILVLDLYIESSDFIYDYTGKLSKTIILSEVPSLEYAFKPMKGFYKLLRVSPPICGDRAVLPTYIVRKVDGKKTFELRSVTLVGNYIVEVGSTSDIINKLYSSFKDSKGLMTRIKFENTFVRYLVNDVRILEPEIKVINGAVVRTLSPALLPNPFTPSQHIRRFTINPSIMLWVPFSIVSGTYTHNTHEVTRSLIILESCLAEHYTSRQKTVFINYNNEREPALEVRAKYLITKNECKELIEKILYAARVFGIGASRASGFGSAEITCF